MAADYVKVKEEFFAEAKRMDGVFKDTFVTGSQDLGPLVNEILEDTIFSGKAKDGLMELLEIVRDFYKDLTEKGSEYFTTFEKLKSNMEEVEAETIYKDVQP